MFDKEQKSRETLMASFIVLFCLISVFLASFQLNRSSSSSSSKEGESASKIVSNFMKDKVVTIPLEGVIYDSVSPSNTPFKKVYNATYLKAKLEAALDDEHTKAVVLRVNSPGGTVAVSQEIYELVSKFEEKKKAVVVSMSDVCASGCYYIASAADAIVANRGTITGSIGVISQGLNYKGLFDKLGLYDQTFKAGKFKDLGSGSRVVSQEEKEILQALLNDSYDQFLTDIEAGRDIPREKLEKIAQGLIYTGRQALEVGLVDNLGTLSFAKEKVKTILKDKYEYEDVDSLKFVDSWSAKKISGLGNVFDIGFSSLADDFVDSLGVKLLGNSQKSQSSYQPLWLMQ